MDTPIGKTTLGELLPFLIVIFILFLFMVFCFYMAIITSKAKKQRKIKLRELQSNGMTLCGNFLHVNGLPIAENIMCDINSYPDRYEIKANNMQFSLNKNKVSDVCIKSETDFQQQYVSSVGGAIGGAMLFGPLGAVIGGRAKKKTTKQVSFFLIITYLNDTEIKYIGFDVTNGYFTAQKFVNEFIANFNPTNNNNIEL